MIDLEQTSSILQKLGFSDKEAHVYLVLLELNEALASTLARKTGVIRSTAYSILEHLQKRGLVSTVRRNGNTYYQAQNPHMFLSEKRSTVQDMQQALRSLEIDLPQILELHKEYKTPQMSVFKGKEGLIQVMQDTLTTSTELLCWCDVDLATNTVLTDYFPEYLRQKMEKQIWLKGIFCYDQASLRHKKEQEVELREVYLIPKEEFPFDNEINIYDDKVAIISYEDEVGVIIQNEHIANTQRSIFNFAFKYARLHEHEVLTEEDKAYLADPRRITVADFRKEMREAPNNRLKHLS